MKSKNMENKYLQLILQAGLLDLGDSDERLENIEKSIADLEAKLKKQQSLLPAYTLVALDPNINPEEPVLTEVEAIIATHWKALRAKFSERPILIIRAVILHALYNVGIHDAKIARIIHLTATNFYPYAKLEREKSIVENILSELAELAEKNAMEEWSLVDEEPKIKIGTLKVDGLKSVNISVNGNSLKQKLVEAANRSSGYNPYQHPDEWAESFSNHATNGISKAIETASNDVVKSLDLSLVETSINKFFAEFKKSLDQSLKDSFTSIQAVERRSKLLWWKETLYSSSLENSYRSVSEILQPVIMANDLYNQLPSITPVSVDYLLRDTLILINNKADEKITFSELLEQISKIDNTTVLKYYLEDIDLADKRISITDFLSLLINGKVQASSLKQYTGIDENEQVSLTDIAVMILHDLMAEYLVPKSK